MSLKKLAPLFLAVSAALFAARFGIDQIGRIVRLADPQIAPDGRSIALVVSRTNYEEDRYDPELVLIDVATHNQRSLTRDRRGVSQARWSPDGSRLAFLATVDTRPQIFVLPMTGGDAWQVTKSPTGIQQYAWRPGRSRAKNATTARSKSRITTSCCRKRPVRPTSG
jgi:dipeptidyl aminopeptidase/acylaminoacyl peptidase